MRRQPFQRREHCFYNSAIISSAAICEVARHGEYTSIWRLRASTASVSNIHFPLCCVQGYTEGATQFVTHTASIAEAFVPRDASQTAGTRGAARGSHPWRSWSSCDTWWTRCGSRWPVRGCSRSSGSAGRRSRWRTGPRSSPCRYPPPAREVQQTGHVTRSSLIPFCVFGVNICQTATLKLPLNCRKSIKACRKRIAAWELMFIYLWPQLVQGVICC